MPIEEEVCQILHGMTLTQEEADTIARMAQIRVRKSKFEIGQKVRIKASGQEFTITAIAEKRWPEVRYTADEVSRWYPASSLELVEEPLAIGDEVEVIGPAGDEYITTPDDPKTFVITEIREPHDGFGRTYRTKNTGQPGYPASSLRKIPKPGTSWQITEAQRLAEAEDKLADMEKQLADLKEAFRVLEMQREHALDGQTRINSEIQKRLHDLEAWQKEQIEKEKAERRVKKAIVRGMLEQMAEPELKVGDWVQVVGMAFDGDSNWTGSIQQIEALEPARITGSSHPYPIKSLRPLSPEEIARRLNEVPA